jgi:hypothetical protein
MRELKVATSTSIKVFMADSYNHLSGKAGQTLTVYLSKPGAPFVQINTNVTDLGYGWYEVTLTASHTDTLGDIALHITAPGADPTEVLCRIVAIDVMDGERFGLANIDVPTSSRFSNDQFQVSPSWWLPPTVGPGSGSGAYARTYVLRDQAGNPIPNAEAWVSTDSYGSNVVAGTLVTDAFGSVTFLLDAGTYYMWRQHADFTFNNPETITVP